MGNKVYLFGGEDAARRPQGDLFILDLADMEWQSPEVTGRQALKCTQHADDHASINAHCPVS